MEKWDLYTKYREKTGEAYIRQDECMIPEGKYHLVVHVWIRNSKGEYVISQRAADRAAHPLEWECAGGSVLYGESSIEGAIRETAEEVGIRLDPSKGKLLFSKIRNDYDGIKFRDIMDVWLFEYDGDIDLERASTGEVAGTIDRPLGSVHPKHPDMRYPVNYGYVNGVIAGDCAEQDVYVFGTDEPITNFAGKVIAVYHRFDDVEDKWIVSLDGKDVPDDRILGDIAFQEQFFYGKLYR